MPQGPTQTGEDVDLTGLLGDVIEIADDYNHTSTSPIEAVELDDLTAQLYAAMEAATEFGPLTNFDESNAVKHDDGPPTSSEEELFGEDNNGDDVDSLFGESEDAPLDQQEEAVSNIVVSSATPTAPTMALNREPEGLADTRLERQAPSPAPGSYLAIPRVAPLPLPRGVKPTMATPSRPSLSVPQPTTALSLQAAKAATSTTSGSSMRGGLTLPLQPMAKVASPSGPAPPTAGSSNPSPSAAQPTTPPNLVAAQAVIPTASGPSAKALSKCPAREQPSPSAALPATVPGSPAAVTPILVGPRLSAKKRGAQEDPEEGASSKVRKRTKRTDGPQFTVDQSEVGKSDELLAMQKENLKEDNPWDEKYRRAKKNSNAKRWRDPANRIDPHEELLLKYKARDIAQAHAPKCKGSPTSFRGQCLNNTFAGSSFRRPAPPPATRVDLTGDDDEEDDASHKAVSLAERQTTEA